MERNNKVPQNARKVMVALIILLVVAVSWSGYIDRQTEDYVDNATLQAVAAYATARVLNAGISVATSIEVGAVVSVQPLEILDPVHDLVEQYSSIMKLAIGSLVIQKVLLEMIATGFFKILLTIVAVLLTASLFAGDGAFAALMFRLFSLACLVRFLLLLAVGINGLVDEAYVDHKTQQNMVELETLSREVETLATRADGAGTDTSWYADMASRFAAARDLASLEKLKEKAEVAVPAMLNLMALFMLKTLLLPLLFLWLLVRGFRAIWSIDLPALVRQELDNRSGC